MKWFDKLCTLALRKLIERNKENLVLSSQQEFYNIGFVHGERVGAQHMADVIEQNVRSRHGIDVEEADIEAARKGSLH